MKESTKKILYWTGLIAAVAAFVAITVSIVIDSARLMNLALGINALIQVPLWVILYRKKDSKMETNEQA